MASAQALGGALSYNPLLTPDTNSKIYQLQQQQALAKALQEQGLTPIDTNNRMMGQIAYKISPFEGLNKLAQALVGGYEQRSAASDYSGLADGSQAQGAGNSILSPAGQALTAGAGPYGSAMAFSDPNELMKIGVTAAMGDHRAGSSYVGNDGQRHFVPTDQQQNDIPVGGATPQPTQPIPNGTPAPSLPVDGPQVLPGAPQPMQPQGIPASQLQQAGAPVPPAASPVGIPTPPPSTGGIQLQGSPPATMPESMPEMSKAPLPGESSNAFHNRLEVEKANQIARGSIKPAIEKKIGEVEGENAAEDLQQYISARTQTQSVLDKINDMHQANKLSSFNALNSEGGAGPMSFYHRLRSDPTSQANTKLEQIRDQGLISQVGPQLAATGAKGNRLLEGIITGSDSFRLDQGKPAVATSIDGLGLNYIRNQVSQYDKAKESGANPPALAPVLMRTPKGVGYVDPRHVGDVINKGGTFDLSDAPLILPKGK